MRPPPLGDGRQVPVDVARGGLLVAMLAVHLVSAHGSAAAVRGLHGWLGIFLISGGFVALSGYVTAARPRPLERADVLRALESCLHLLLVMFAYGVLLSLVRHGLALLVGGPEACAARAGWTPPRRFDDLGILLPIALLQPLGLVGRLRGRRGVAVLFVLALAWMTLPAWSARAGGAGIVGGLLGVLNGRTLTPFYTVSLFVAVGLMGAWLGRRSLAGEGKPAPRALAWGALALAVGLASPRVSAVVLNRAYVHGGELGGAVATLAYWTAAVRLFLYGCSAERGSSAHDLLARLGRNSLLVFILHDLLLALDAFARTALGAGKGLAFVLPAFIVNLVLLVGACAWVERSARVRAVAAGALLDRRRQGAARSALFTPFGGVALAGILAVYTSAALARADEVFVIDDWEGPASCPPWWTFGELRYARAAPDAAGSRYGRSVLQVRGRAPGMFAHGMGLFMTRDVGTRRTLSVDVRGHGPASGRMKIELCEDDNGNWEIEKDPRLYTPIYDDRFVYELTVDWQGWRTITLPVTRFTDDNPNSGNNTYDPARDLTSGGLLEVQLLFSPAGPGGDEISLDLDNLRWLP